LFFSQDTALLAYDSHYAVEVSEEVDLGVITVEGFDGTGAEIFVVE